MKTRYEISAQAVCPIDNALIDYFIQITIWDKRGHAFIKAEDLIEAISEMTSQPVMQEPLTKTIANKYQASAPRIMVRTIATHSGVGIVCTVKRKDRPFPRSDDERFDHYRRLASHA